MLREMKLTPEEAETILYTKSGLLGMSGISNDMRVLRAKSEANADAKLAIDTFVYRVTREIGSLIAALGGIDGLVFTAGIGENDVVTRAEVISGLAWARFHLDAGMNRTGGPRTLPNPVSVGGSSPRTRKGSSHGRRAKSSMACEERNILKRRSMSWRRCRPSRKVHKLSPNSGMRRSCQLPIFGTI